MWWLVDNANTCNLLLGIVALSFATAWWLERRNKLLLGVAAALAGILLVWLLTKFIVTDRRQLEINIRAMADAVVAGKSETLLQHFAQDFTFQGRKRQELAESAAKGAKHFGVGQIQLWNLSIDEVNRDKRSAKLSFEVTVRDNDGEYLAKPLHCETGFVLQNERWLLQKLLFFDLAGKTPLQIPLP